MCFAYVLTLIPLFSINITNHHLHLHRRIHKLTSTSAALFRVFAQHSGVTVLEALSRSTSPDIQLIGANGWYLLAKLVGTYARTPLIGVDGMELDGIGQDRTGEKGCVLYVNKLPNVAIDGSGVTAMALWLIRSVNSMGFPSSPSPFPSSSAPAYLPTFSSHAQTRTLESLRSCRRLVACPRCCT